MKLLKLIIKSIFKIIRFILEGYNGCYNHMLLKKGKNIVIGSYNVNGRIFIQNEGFIAIGNNFKGNSGRFYNPIGGDEKLILVTGKNGKLIIGENVGISNSAIVCWESVRIENNVLIGGGCKIWDTDFHSLKSSDRNKTQDNNYKTAPIIIKENAFIGADCILLKGVEVGNNSVVAAGSVVSRKIPANEVWGGNPIQFIKKID